MRRKHILGIDTSNYRTSVSVVDIDGNIALDERKLLKVKKGERGLRQSDALFQHTENLPVLFEALRGKGFEFAAVAASDRPRPVQGSYMPCFKAGFGFGKAVAASLDIPFYTFSHQEGHIEAVRSTTCITGEKPFLAWHMSGGTCELLRVESLNHKEDACAVSEKQQFSVEIIGGSKDISFGQVIDRAGVLLGMCFPAGEEMDKLVLNSYTNYEKYAKQLTKIKTDGLFFNLSGIETQAGRLIEGFKSIESSPENTLFEAEKAELLVLELFDKISDTVINVTAAASESTGIKDIIFAGGVSCSRYISEKIIRHFERSDINIQFGRQELSGDNAVGTALLGGKAYGYETR